MVLEVQARHPGRCNLPQSVSEKNQRRSDCQGASGENPRQNHSRPPSGAKKIKEQQGHEDSEENIEALTVEQGRMDEKNREEHSQQQAEEHSQQQARAEPTAGKANQRATTETRRSTRPITRRNTVQKKAAVSQSRSF